MSAVIGILLGIFKWIGIILLWILGIIFGLILLVVLLIIAFTSVPIRIRVSGHYRAEDILAQGRVSYLLKLVLAEFFFKDKQFAWQVKLGGKKFLPKEASAESESESLSDSPVKDPEEAASDPSAENAEPAAEQSDPLAADVNEFSEEAVDLFEEACAVNTAEEAAEAEKDLFAEPEDPEVPGGSEEAVPDWAKDLMKPIGPDKLDVFWEKVGAVIAKVSDIWEMIAEYPDKPGLVRAFKRFLIHLCKTFRFEPSQVHVDWGDADPAKTGQVTAAIASVGSLIQWKNLNVEVVPHFEEPVLAVEGNIACSLILRKALGAVFGLLINRSLWKLGIYLLTVLNRKKSRKKKGIQPK